MYTPSPASDTAAPAQSRAKSLILSGRRMPTRDRRPLSNAVEPHRRGSCSAQGAGEAAGHGLQRARGSVFNSRWELALELAVALEPRLGEAPLGDRFLDRASRLGLVRAVRKAARSRQLGHVGERRRPPPRRPRGQLAHSGVEDEPAARERHELAVCGRVPAPPVAAERLHLLALPAERRLRSDDLPTPEEPSSATVRPPPT